jgi:purine-binding chemotaxis protein CheW
MKTETINKADTEIRAEVKAANNAENKAMSSLLDWMPKGELAERILRERAHHLKEKKIDREGTSLQWCHYVRFKLGKEYYGIPFQDIKEVISNTLTTAVPNAPNYITGIINRHGVLLSILDLGAFFHIPPAEDSTETTETFLLVISALKMTVAILVDTLIGSEVYSPSTLDAALATEGAIKPKYVLGLHQGKTAILNIEALITTLQSSNTALKENPL